jgi:hypothetical protein
MGQVMDYLSSGYTSTARWGTGADETFTLRWYRAAPGAQVYQGMHAYGSTVWDNPLFDDSTKLGEIRPVYRDWSPSDPAAYDGTRPVVTPASLQYGVSAEVMDVPCVDGSIGFMGTATTGFAPVVYGPSIACSCDAVTAPQ